MAGVWFPCGFTCACMLTDVQISIRHFRLHRALILMLARIREPSITAKFWLACARAGVWVTVALALASVATAVRCLSLLPSVLELIERRFVQAIFGGRFHLDLEPGPSRKSRISCGNAV